MLNAQKNLQYLISHSTPTHAFPAGDGFPAHPSASQLRLLHCLLSVATPPSSPNCLFDLDAFAAVRRMVVRVVKPCGTGKTFLCTAFLRYVLSGAGWPKAPSPLGGIRQIPRAVLEEAVAEGAAVPEWPAAFPHAAAVLCPAAILDMWKGVLESAGLRVRAVEALKGKEKAPADALRKLAAEATGASPIVFLADASVKTARGGRAQLLEGFGRGGAAQLLSTVVVDEGDALQINKCEAGEALPAAKHTLLATAREGPAPPHTLMWEAEVAGRERVAGGHAPLLELKATQAYIDEAARGLGCTAATALREEAVVPYPAHFQSSMEAFPAEERQVMHSICNPGDMEHNELFMATEKFVRMLQDSEGKLLDLLSRKYYTSRKDTNENKIRKRADLAAVQGKLEARRKAVQAAEDSSQLVCPICLESWQALQEGGCGGLRTYACGHWTCAKCATQNDAKRAQSDFEVYEDVVPNADGVLQRVQWSEASSMAPAQRRKVLEERRRPKCPMCNRTKDLAFKPDTETPSKGSHIRDTLRAMGADDRLCVIYSDKMQRDTAAELLRGEGRAFEDLDRGSLTKKLERLHADPKRALLMGAGAQQGLNLHQLCKGTMNVLRVGALDANARMQAEGRFTRMGSTHERLVLKRLRCELEDDEEATDISMLTFNARQHGRSRMVKRQKSSGDE